jgi:hypothetical protein
MYIPLSHTHTHTYIYIYIHTLNERERERERDEFRTEFGEVQDYLTNPILQPFSLGLSRDYYDRTTQNFEFSWRQILRLMASDM